MKLDSDCNNNVFIIVDKYMCIKEYSHCINSWGIDIKNGEYIFRYIPDIFAKHVNIEGLKMNIHTYKINKDKILIILEITKETSKMKVIKNEIERGLYSYISILKTKGIDKVINKNGISSVFQIMNAIKESSFIHKEEDLKFYNIGNNTFIFLINADRKEVVIDKLSLIKKESLKRIEPSISKDICFIFAITIINSTFENVLNKAETTLNTAEENSYEMLFYDKDNTLIKRKIEHEEWQEKTVKMIKEEKIFPYYQPIKDIKTNEINKYEVLARGEFNGEIISPYFFLNIAKELGLLRVITDIIIDKSFKYMSEKKDISFNINITEEDILSDSFILFIEKSLGKYTIKPENVTFEILENITNFHENTVLDNLKKIKSMGFNIAIDDFGSENSNFSRLININCDYLKIDEIFIRKIEDNEKNKKIVSSIVSMAKTLGIKTVAEYVENENIYNIIKECGVDYAQGYFIDKPKDKI